MHLYTLLKYAIKMRIFPVRLSEIKLCETWTSIVKCMLKQNKNKHRFYPRVIASPTQDVILRQRERRCIAEREECMYTVEQFLGGAFQGEEL